jgi:tetratricopeptide (TPR) repeat protein
MQLGMSRTTKTLLYIGLTLSCLTLAYAFSVEHTRGLRQAAGAGFLALVIGLGVLCVFDISHYFGERAKQWFLQGGAPITSAPEFEAAEKLRASGQALDAIGVLREFLQAHPGEVQVMSRIAEIYNYDLKNYLAAALEYEELLKCRMDPEQWGWAALHLAKLYGRLNEPDKSLALLERLQTKYGKTVAARRARKALEQLQDSESEDQQNPI